MMVVRIPAGKESVDWHSAKVQYSASFFKWNSLLTNPTIELLKNLNPTKLYHCFTTIKLLRQREYPAAKVTIEITDSKYM